MLCVRVVLPEEGEDAHVIKVGDLFCDDEDELERAARRAGTEGGTQETHSRDGRWDRR